MPPEVVECLIALKCAKPDQSVRLIIKAAQDEGIDHPLAPSTVHRLFSREGLFDAGPPTDGADRRRFAFREAGELWMRDVIHGPKVRHGRTRRKTYLIAFVDDATRVVPFAAFALRNDVLEDLRLLTNFAMDAEQRLCLVLVGLTELRRRLAMHESLAQRLVVRHHLAGLDRDETGAYVSHRLRLAGCELPLFEAPAVEALFQSARGLPRQINRIAHYALYAAEDAGHIVRARLQGIVGAAGARFETLDIAVIDVPALRLDHRADRRRLVETVERIRPRLLVLAPSSAFTASTRILSPRSPPSLASCAIYKDASRPPCCSYIMPAKAAPPNSALPQACTRDTSSLIGERQSRTKFFTRLVTPHGAGC